MARRRYKRAQRARPPVPWIDDPESKAIVASFLAHPCAAIEVAPVPRKRDPGAGRRRRRPNHRASMRFDGSIHKPDEIHIERDFEVRALAKRERAYSGSPLAATPYVFREAENSISKARIPNFIR